MRRLLAAYVSPLPLVLALAVTAAAQEAEGPAPQLQQLEPFVGNWRGEGEATFGPGAPPTRWRAKGSYRWVLGGHWLQEDFAIEFDGVPTPMVKHGFLGWDAAGRRYVRAGSASNGEVSLQPMTRLEDGSFVELTLRSADGAPQAHRSLLRVTGDGLRHDIAVWMATGPVQPVTTATFTRCEEPYTADLDAAAFAGTTPHPDVRRLARSAGEYATAGTVTMGPGAQPFQIRGTETFRPAFGDTVFLGISRGKPDGAPTTYEGHVLWGHDAARGSVIGVYVGNHGEVTTMDARWLPNGKLSTTTMTTGTGMSRVERFVMEFGDDGAAKSAVSHELVDDLPPSETFRITYQKK